MKHYFLAAVALLLLVSCKEQTGEVVFNAAESIGTLPATLSGSTGDAIKQAWNKELDEAGTPSEIGSLQIVQLTVTSDDVTFKATHQYALKAVTKDKKTTVTALLIVKGKEFYLDANAPAIVCTGNCQTPCEPSAIHKEGKIVLVCSGCSSCVKTAFML